MILQLFNGSHAKTLMNATYGKTLINRLTNRFFELGGMGGLNRHVDSAIRRFHILIA